MSVLTAAIWSALLTVPVIAVGITVGVAYPPKD